MQKQNTCLEEPHSCESGSSLTECQCDCPEGNRAGMCLFASIIYVSLLVTVPVFTDFNSTNKMKDKRQPLCKLRLWTSPTAAQVIGNAQSKQQFLICVKAVILCVRSQPWPQRSYAELPCRVSWRMIFFYFFLNFSREM